MFVPAERLGAMSLPLRLLLALAVAVAGGMIGSTHDALGQDEMNTCKDTLKVANRAYQNRNFEKAIELASQCTEQEAVAEATAIQAYRRQGLSFLRQGMLVQARSAVDNILDIDPTYTADQVEDPPSYSLLVSMVRYRRGLDVTESTVEATRSKRVETAFFVKLGAGISDYTGDLPAQNSSHPFDFQEFITGSGIPFALNGEFGYRFGSRWALALGFQAGNYPIVGYSTGNGDITDSRRYTPHLLVRYTFATPGESISFYLDGGLNATFGGEGRASTGFGPSVGGGVDFPLGDALSFYVESHFHGTLPDEAIDGSETRSSFIDGIDSVNQLFGVGLKLSFGSEADPTRQ